MSAVYWLGPGGDRVDDETYRAKRAAGHLQMDSYRAFRFIEDEPKVDASLKIIALAERLVDIWRARKSLYIRENSLYPYGSGPWADLLNAVMELKKDQLQARDQAATAHIVRITEALKPLAELVEQKLPCSEIDVIEAAVRMLKLQLADVKEYGPFLAVVNQDGNTLRCNDVGDPYVFKQMGPHDNHTRYGRRVVPVVIVERDRLCRMTKLDVSAEVGKPWQATAVFDGDGVRAFAAHMAQWFRENGGRNFISMEATDTVSGERFELTMQRAGAKTPAQSLSEMRTLLQQIYNADREASNELKGMGVDGVKSKFQHAIEDVLGLPSTKPAGDAP